MERKNYYTQMLALENECLNDIKEMLTKTGGKVEFTETPITVALYDTYGDICFVEVDGVYNDDNGALFASRCNGKDFLVEDIVNNMIFDVYDEVFAYTQK